MRTYACLERDHAGDPGAQHNERSSLWKGDRGQLGEGSEFKPSEENICVKGEQHSGQYGRFNMVRIRMQVR
jgi:hypothetical protein